MTVEAAILHTVLYADVFDFALTTTELHQYLICDRAFSLADITRTLQHSPSLQGLLCQQDGYIALAERPHLIDRRRTQQPLALNLLQTAQVYGRQLAALPFVRMVAITGAIAMQNPARPDDDIDYILVVQAGRVWLTRALSVVLVRLARLRGVELCPNYVLAEDQLVQQRRDLYIAHELAQMLPLYGAECYGDLLAANPWALAYLPHTQPRAIAQQPPPARLKRWGEALLSHRLGDWLESWEYRRKAARFRRQAAQQASAAIIDANTVKGHFRDHGQYILEAYHARLEAYTALSTQ